MVAPQGGAREKRNFLQRDLSARLYLLAGQLVLNLASDPVPQVAEQAQMIVDAIHASFEPAQPPPAPVTAPPVERPRPKHANKRCAASGSRRSKGAMVPYLELASSTAFALCSTASTLLGLIGGAAESQVRRATREAIRRFRRE